MGRHIAEVSADSMFILLNGAFGIGKTTTARALLKELPGSTILDPEPLGMLMQRVLPMLGRPRPDDFQDLAAWRRLTALRAGLKGLVSSSVIIPMAFSNRAYFEEIAAALRRRAPVAELCLVAPFEVVRERLEKRARARGEQPSAWELRRASECCAAHASPVFGRPIDATARLEVVVRDTAYFAAVAGHRA